MTPIRALRDYQTDGIADLHRRWDAGSVCVPMVLSMGLGKTEMFTDPTLLDRFLDAGQRVLIVAHTDELCDQAARKARRNNPGRRVGIVKAGLNDVTAQIIVSSRQTLQSEKRRDQIRRVGLVVIDECHFAVRANTYGKILEHFGAWDEVPRVKVAGFTATLIRGDKQKLSTIWEEVSFSKDILFGIRRGYLLDVRGKRVVVPDLDMGRVSQKAGDFQDNSLAEELERTFAPQVVASTYAEEARRADGTLRQGIAFWPLVETAHHAAEAFNEAGISSAVVWGEMPKSDRRLVLKRFEAGEITVVHNCMALTAGFDAPWADVVVMGRPTRNPGLYQQCVGRGLRPNLELPPEQREKALILDVVGAGAQHDLRSLIDLAPERQFMEREEEFSLLELDDLGLEYEEEERRSGATFEFEGDVYAGATETVAFDPLGRDKVWSRTAGGTWFMSAGTVAYAFLSESVEGDPGTYDVVLCSKAQRGMKPWAKATDHVMLPLDMALGWAEEVAMEVGGYGTKSLTGRKSKWRKEDPTPGQLSMARGLGINPAGMTKGELNEAIDFVKASQRLDPLVAAVKAMQSS